MSQLDKDKARAYELGDLNEPPMAAATTIYEGSAVGENGSGYARQLNAGDPFLGFAIEKAANAGSAGDKNARVSARGRVVLPISGLAVTDIGKQIYASDGDTFTLTASTNSAIGRVIRFVSTGIGVVEYDATRGGVGALVPLTDSSGGTAGDTIAAIGGTYSQTEVRNAVASLAAKINALSARIK